MSCLGCRLANKEETVYVVFEDSDVSCILDHNPYSEGHVLIVPKTHARYMDELDEHTASAVFQAASRMSKTIKHLFKPDGITVCQNGGAFDDLTHFHMHVVPRYEGQNFADFFIEGEEELPIEKASILEETRKKISKAVEGLHE
ncbi:HIT family protein [Paenalkalicoccus suaedae]|uniref:HIT family protein n=1 Tax=Paenalkalicoccus suaedae TaxID=2592382 RepID=A0A859FC36_9BACI|nr:HIT family protein [Paenalkalicoccus suaedae]QKS69845.1 HIT family protein [Paenalkalicoccus suaedae]